MWHQPQEGDTFARSATRLTTLMVDGADQAAAELALERGWDLVSPLPFGKCLNVAINATPTNAADARALLAGNSASDSQTQARAERIMALTTQARVRSEEHTSELQSLMR